MLPDKIRELVAMHRYMRPGGSQTEAEFRAIYLDGLQGVYADKVGNRIGVIGANPVTLWSSHTDTVHKHEGLQRLTWGDGKLGVHEDEKGGCLGADCTVGVWLMRRMFLAKVPGLYIWHAEEETGGAGSDYIATQTPDLLDGIQHAIALDRKGFKSVITHQWEGRTASEDFAKALCAKLGDTWEPDSYGTFTDTANYCRLVPECTNISVGYLNQHSDWETLDTDFAQELLETLLDIDTTDLPVVRDPTFRETLPTYAYHKMGTGSRFIPELDVLEDVHDVVFSRAAEVAQLLLSYGYTSAGALERELDRLPLPGTDTASTKRVLQLG